MAANLEQASKCAKPFLCSLLTPIISFDVATVFLVE